ncbi:PHOSPHOMANNOMUTASE [Encephalitozoon cuniculi GB-M1]|uniref:Phosphomannomutase n=2 Tax=Encephalitozoon cuniculi TaxID=6035 RepID=PMM_ENCCU|nr:phosphomannomutase SEC53 [Encephalitozoon cuniculi GB-M1]Q8SVM5.1 RecName: Full=Phosphomannomutase; Short=PMM [Encephalitozoon cuniculi GB-M1]AGE95433.1 phosphomannomutase [Encephalitozoon cuniculi]KMV66078.1 phosphomannomutase [Encephalitozoon cuniculi EcunIII-L]UYI27813.1 phosphomannomutase [Encephalitozoon cuniculi]CAD26542.1 PHOSPHOMANNOMUTASE [Encephalitozoon cuniculi GB-M1]
MARDEKTIFLFDVDGTLSESRAKMPEKMGKMLESLRRKVRIGFVGGSDLAKQKEQVGDNILEIFDYGFPENGVSFYKNGTLESQEKIIDVLGEEFYKEFANFVLRYLSDIDLPIKRGNFIEYRNSMINISPIGRNCSREERMKFFELDKKEKFREKMVTAMRDRFKDSCLVFSIGGQISIDCFPKGWDKTYCLRHIKKEGVENVYFFGDMTMEGGNDYEIYNHKDVHGISVGNPDDTYRKVDQALKKIGLGGLEEN